jgi:tRNA threonylcarbamoyladenosine biosynthesis protein TsaB
VLILGIESATAQVGCAIGGPDGVLASAHATHPRHHAEHLAPQIDFVRREARVELSEISAVAVDVGPGLYTGLRVGVASALALAHALSVPMVGIPSLDLLAFAARHTSHRIVAMLDARRGEVFVADYQPVPGGVQRVTEHRVVSPEVVAAELLATDGEALLVGDGARRYQDRFEPLRHVEIADQGLDHPSARSLVQLARARALREEFVQSWDLELLYLRKPDAESNWITRHDR